MIVILSVAIAESKDLVHRIFSYLDPRQLLLHCSTTPSPCGYSATLCFAQGDIS